MYMHVVMTVASMSGFADDARDYADREVVPFITQNRDLKKDLVQANKDRDRWHAYSDSWKDWSRTDAKTASEGYTLSEYTWSVTKDDTARAATQEGKSFKRIKSFQDRSHGKVKSVVVTDAKGGAVVATTFDDDWFQGDEQTFKRAKKRIYYGPTEQDETGASFQIVSVPIFEDNDPKEGDLLGVAIVTLVVETTTAEESVVIVSP